MMSRKFTGREKALLLVCAVMLLGIFYYQFLWKSTEAVIASSDISEPAMELEVEEAKTQQMMRMKNEMETLKDELTSEVPSYNNINNVIIELNTILSQADTFSLDFGEAAAEGTTVRRDISVSFHTGSYATMKAILSDLHDCRYRCLIQDLNISAAGTNTGIRSGNDLNVSLTVRFYETTYNADTTAGLAESETLASDTGSTDIE